MKFIEKYAKIIVIIAVFAGSASSVFANLISAPSMAIGFWRLGMAMPFFAVAALAKDAHVLKEISPKDYLWSALGGFFLCCHFFCWFTACRMTNVASAAVLSSFHPIVVLIITLIVFKRKVSPKAILGICIALFGGFLIAGVDTNTLANGDATGNLFAVMTGVFMGLYFAVGNHVRERVPGNAYVFLMFGSTFLCFTAGMIVSGTPFVGYPTMDYVYIFCMAIICQICSHAMFNLCMGHVSGLYVSAWETGECCCATILAMIFLGQMPNILELVGVVVVVSGLLYYNYQYNKSES